MDAKSVGNITSMQYGGKCDARIIEKRRGEMINARGINEERQ